MDAEAKARLAAMGMFDTKQKKERSVPIIKGPFSWPGSKLKSIDPLLELVPYSNKYVEVFGGSGVLLLNRKRSKMEVYNDRHSGLADFWICLRDMPQELIDRISWDINSKELFNHYRDTWDRQTDRLERAARWYFSINYSFNQLGRHWGRERNISLTGKIDNRLALLSGLADRFHGVVVENASWESIVDYYDSADTVFYMDPPYIQTPTGTYEHNMDHKAHLNLLDSIFKLQGTVCLSGYAHELIMSYNWDEVHCWDIADVLGKSRVDVAVREIDREYLYVKRSKLWQGNTRVITA